MIKWLSAASFLMCAFSCVQEEKKVVTFADVAPVIYSNCSPCHRPGSAAPFNLLTYEDVRKKLKTILLAVNSGLMPPWPADTSYSRFRDEKAISSTELDLINRWAKAGALKGDASAIPPPPSFHENVHADLPAMTIGMKKAFFIPGDNKDRFMMTKIPMSLERDTFIKAIEIVPGNKKIVHHVNAHIIQYYEGRKKTTDGGASFVDAERVDKRMAYEALDLANDDGSYPLLTPSVTNYLPGVEPALYPEGIGGYRVKKHSVLLVDNIHYGPSATNTTDSTIFRIYFSATPPERPARDFILGTSGIAPVQPPLVIPAGETRLFTVRYTVPEDISLLTINPHMHLLGKSFTAFAILPGGDTLPLIRILRWDFRWQYFYTFRKIVKLPAGTEIIAEGIFDNTAENPLNPFSPPQTVSERDGSMRTTDEMLQLICTYITYRPGDEKISLERSR